jgi:transposase
MAADTKFQLLFDTLKLKVPPDSIVYTDSCGIYNILNASDFRHYRINLIANAPKANLMNSIENFWNQEKQPLRK